MKNFEFNRRKFIKDAAATAAGFAVLPTMARETSNVLQEKLYPMSGSSPAIYQGPPRIKFSVIGINHGHIYSQVEATIRGGGEFVSFYAKEPDLAQAFAKRFPQAKQASSEKEILEDKSIQLVLSSIIPDE